MNPMFLKKPGLLPIPCLNIGKRNGQSSIGHPIMMRSVIFDSDLKIRHEHINIHRPAFRTYQPGELRFRYYGQTGSPQALVDPQLLDAIAATTLGTFSRAVDPSQRWRCPKLRTAWFPMADLKIASSFQRTPQLNATGARTGLSILRTAVLKRKEHNATDRTRDLCGCRTPAFLRSFLPRRRGTRTLNLATFGRTGLRFPRLVQLPADDAGPGRFPIVVCWSSRMHLDILP